MCWMYRCELFIHQRHGDAVGTQRTGMVDMEPGIGDCPGEPHINCRELR